MKSKSERQISKVSNGGLPDWMMQRGARPTAEARIALMGHVRNFFWNWTQNDKAGMEIARKGAKRIVMFTNVK